MCLWGSTDALDLKPEFLLQLKPFIFSVVKVDFHRHFHGCLSKSHGLSPKVSDPKGTFSKEPSLFMHYLLFKVNSLS